LAVLTASISLVATPLSAQHASEFTIRDKSEIFIQHLVKVLRLDPAKYEAMVLEYEIGTVLAELSDEVAAELAGVDFIQNSLGELYPSYGRALDAFAQKKPTEVEVALRGLDTKALGSKTNPYLEAYVGLLRAEIDFRAGKYDDAIRRCEALSVKYRERMIADHRVCELIALSFNKKDRPLLEFSQYAILLTDYDELPKGLKERAEARMAALNGDHGRPLHTVASWMRQVEKLLSEEVTAKDPTQSEENKIVVALDKLIELQEAVERQACKSCGGSCNGACQNGNPNGQKSKSPAKVSKLPNRGNGIVRLNGVSRARRDTIWGLLNEKDASRALKSFGGKLPPRYEKLLKKYYKRLSKDQ
jgi:hypothetical protein